VNPERAAQRSCTLVMRDKAAGSALLAKAQAGRQAQRCWCGSRLNGMELSGPGAGRGWTELGVGSE
jgi:hypothetical protein